MVGEQHPLDIADAIISKMLQHSAVTQIDKNCGIAVAKDMDITGIPVQKDAWPIRVGRSKFGGRLCECYP
jgi:hypothetical protein